MSARGYGKFQVSYWRHHKIRALGEDARWMGAYLLTSPHSNSIGSYLLPDGYAAGDLQWSQERVSQSLSELFAKGFALRFVLNPDYICVCDHFQWNRPESPNVVKNMIAQFDVLPRDVVRIYALAGILATGSWVPKHARPRLGALFDQLNPCFFEHFGKAFETQTKPDPEPEPSQTRTSVRGGVGSNSQNESSTQFPRAREIGAAVEGLGNDGGAQTPALDFSGGGSSLQDRVAQHAERRRQAEQRKSTGST